ncbi:MAG: hypothetical protein KKC20_16815, partial [Proteobacteria bacterium]|nr:hypothetical protein [Pseudomonadota bacterium]
TSDITVNLTYGGTATGSGTDYTGGAAAITITAGQTTGTTAITIVDDAAADPNETITVDIASVVNGEDGASLQTATITDNDDSILTGIDGNADTLTGTNGVKDIFVINDNLDTLMNFNRADGDLIRIDKDQAASIWSINILDDYLWASVTPGNDGGTMAGLSASVAFRFSDSAFSPTGMPASQPRIGNLCFTQLNGKTEAANPMSLSKIFVSRESNNSTPNVNLLIRFSGVVSIKPSDFKFI